MSKQEKLEKFVEKLRNFIETDFGERVNSFNQFEAELERKAFLYNNFNIDGRLQQQLKFFSLIELARGGLYSQFGDYENVLRTTIRNWREFRENHFQFFYSPVHAVAELQGNISLEMEQVITHPYQNFKIVGRLPYLKF